MQGTVINEVIGNGGCRLGIVWNLGSQTLVKAVTVKLTRTLAIIPITLVSGGIPQERHQRR